MVTMYSAELRSLFCINLQFEMQVATSLRISIWHGRIKFTFAFRNEKIESICGIQVYCKDLRGAYCYNYNLNMFVQNTYLQQVCRDLTFKWELKSIFSISNFIISKISQGRISFRGKSTYIIAEIWL